MWNRVVCLLVVNEGHIQRRLCTCAMTQDKFVDCKLFCTASALFAAPLLLFREELINIEMLARVRVRQKLPKMHMVISPSLSLLLSLPLSLYLSLYLNFLSLSLGPLHAPLPHGAVRSHVRAGLNPPGPDPVGSEGPEGLRSKDGTTYREQKRQTV
eukprot:sb/3473155/